MPNDDVRAAIRRGSAPRTVSGFGGGQVRSYVLAPYTLVKDLRTGVETSDADAVLDGNIDRFLEAGIVWSALGRRRSPSDPIPE
jgi:peptide chain release factor 2